MATITMNEIIHAAVRHLRTLAEVDPELADQREAEHLEMAAAMVRASAAMNQFAAAATEDSAATAADAVAAAAAVTDRHLDHEEQAVMPIVVAHRETPEWKVVEKKLRGAVGNAGPFIAWLQDGMEPPIARALSGTIPAPVRLVLSRVAGRSYHREIAPVWR